MHFTIDKLKRLKQEVPGSYFTITRHTRQHYTVGCYLHGSIIYMTERPDQPLIFSSLDTAETFLSSHIDELYCLTELA